MTSIPLHGDPYPAGQGPQGSLRHALALAAGGAPRLLEVGTPRVLALPWAKSKSSL